MGKSTYNASLLGDGIVPMFNANIAQYAQGMTFAVGWTGRAGVSSLDLILPWRLLIFPVSSLSLSWLASSSTPFSGAEPQPLWSSA